MRLSQGVAIFVTAALVGALVAPSGGAAVWAVACAATLALGLAAAGARAGGRRRGLANLAAALLLAAAAGFWMGARAIQPRSLPAAFAAALDDEQKHLLDATVAEASEGADGAEGGFRLRAIVDAIDGLAIAPTTIGVAVHEGRLDLLPGDRVRLPASLHAVRGLANPGVPDAALQARAAGIDAWASTRAASLVERRDEGARSAMEKAPPGASLRAWLWRTAARVHLALRAAIARPRPLGSTPDSVRLLLTAVLGERAQVGTTVEDGFRAAGATHVLSVSGLHLAAVGFVFFGGARRALGAVPRLPLWIDPRRVAALLALPAIAFYAILSGGAVATVRAALMMGVGLVGVALGRRAATLTTIAAAALILVAWSPLVLFDVSFQLSVVSVLALAVAGPLGRHLRATRDDRWRRRAAMGVARLGLATLAAGTTTAPIVAHAFGEVTPAAPLGNLILVPLVEATVVPFGLAGAGLAALGAVRVGSALLAVAHVAARLGLWLAEGFRRAAPVWLTRAPSAFETAAAVAAALLALTALPAAAVWRRGRFVVAGALLAAASASGLAREGARRWRPDTVDTFLDAGQGDAAVLEAPGGRTILIDGGGSVDGAFDPGARVVEPFLRARGITRLDLVVLSHPHPDHMGGLARVVQRFAIGALWTSGDDGHDPRYAALVGDARARGVGLPVPDRLVLGRLTLEPLGPFVSEPSGVERIGPPEGTSVNDASLVVRATFGSRALLFAGDLEADGEGELVGRTSVGAAIDADILKVPHHGSRTSSSAELLDGVRPRVAVMSLGWKNRFHFPNPEVVARYDGRGVRVLRTDRDGAVTVRVGADGAIDVACARACPWSRNLR